MPVSDFFAVSIRVQTPAVVLAPPVVPVSVPAVAQVTAVAVSVLEMGCCTGVGTGNGIAACPVTKLLWHS